MSSIVWLLYIFTLLLFPAVCGSAQITEICGETGSSAWLSSSAVYGRVGLNGFDLSKRLPRIVITVTDSQRNEHTQTITETGNYCFMDLKANGGWIVLEVEGKEIGRRSLPTGLITQHRQDFEVYAENSTTTKPPSTISAKNAYPRSEKNAVLLEKAAAEEKNQQLAKAIQYLKQIVSDDPKDFVAWFQLGAIYFGQNNFSEAESAYKNAIGAKPDHTPSLLNLGRIYLVNKKHDEAIVALLKATQTEPTAARGFQLLGEAYLLSKKGTLGVEALNEAIRLDPVGMAECHLLMARLYDAAGAKPLASREYRLFLEKVPNHADKEKFQQYIKDNPE
jgi:tetratricopeptide (TPR) repeat protein